jgi:hypothetical protein
MPYSVTLSTAPMNIGPRLLTQSLKDRVCKGGHLRDLSRTFCHSAILSAVNKGATSRGDNWQTSEGVE